jgi:ribosomal protein L7/L12
MHDAFEEEIRRMLESGNKILAIKRYREETGVGLAEAKAAVESLEAGGSFIKPVQPDDPNVADEIVTLLSHGEKIKAIKLYRQQFRVGLKEAKEAIDDIGEQNGIPSSSGYGCLSVVLLGITVILGLLN